MGPDIEATPRLNARLLGANQPESPPIQHFILLMTGQSDVQWVIIEAETA